MDIQYSKLTTATPELQLMQDNIAETFAQVASKPELNNVFLENILVTAGYVNNIEHNLGRAIRGWRVCRVNAPTMIYENTSTSTNKLLSLITTATCTVSILVF